MGLTKIDERTSEWERREMRRHNIKQWAITIGEILLMFGAVYLIVWLCSEVHP